MTEFLREWILGLVMAAILSSIALAVTPKGQIRSIVAFVCGIVMIVAMVAPIFTIDDIPGENFTPSRFDIEAEMDRIDEFQASLVGGIIRGQSEAYIWDKAEQLGIVPYEIIVETTFGESGHYYPLRIFIHGTFTASARAALSEYLLQTFGITLENQHWRDDDG